MIEFWEDYYYENPLEAHRDESGEVRFQTGDPQIDRWEEQVARGEEPDYDEIFSKEQLEKIEKLRNRSKSNTLSSATLKQTKEHIEEHARSEGLQDSFSTFGSGYRNQ
jgi:hypothetical protein